MGILHFFLHLHDKATDFTREVHPNLQTFTHFSPWEKSVIHNASFRLEALKSPKGANDIPLPPPTDPELHRLVSGGKLRMTS